MKTEKLGQEPAFSTSSQLEGEAIYEAGMSKRFYAACAAMQGIASAMSSRMGSSVEDDVKLAYSYADELLSQENL